MSGFDLLAEGKFFDSIIYPYQNMLGSAGIELFWGILIFAAMGLTYIKTRSPVLLGIIGLVSGVVLIPILPPQTRGFIYGLMVFGVATLIYKVYKSR